jgi:hypothetical protein
VELCNAYLSALGNAMIDASSVLTPPSPGVLVKRGEECMSRHPEMATRWRIDLVKGLARAAVLGPALARLEALDAEGLLRGAEPAEQAELGALGHRLALALGRTDAAARWASRAAGATP